MPRTEDQICVHVNETYGAGISSKEKHGTGWPDSFSWTEYIVKLDKKCSRNT